ncbi:MAG: PIN domain-containing protein [Spirochaetaceae bacterium]|nr:PIN domain-containing protein [Spirochaetaceae bacterium]
MPRFVDTNVLVYAVSSAPDEAEKQAAAQSLLGSADIVLSVQVLQEFYHQVTRPSRPGRLSHESAIQFVEGLSRRPVMPVTVDLFRSATAISQRYQISYWDAAIIAAAEAMGCDAVYSEDLNAGQDYGGILLINPFSTRG